MIRFFNSTTNGSVFCLPLILVFIQSLVFGQKNNSQYQSGLSSANAMTRSTVFIPHPNQLPQQVTLESNIFMLPQDDKFEVNYKGKVIYRGSVTDLEIDKQAMGAVHVLPVKKIYFAICERENGVQPVQDMEFSVLIPSSQSELKYRLRMEEQKGNTIEANALYKALEIVNDQSFRTLIEYNLFGIEEEANRGDSNLERINKYLVGFYSDSIFVRVLKALPFDVRNQLITLRSKGNVLPKSIEEQTFLKSVVEVKTEKERFDFLVALINQVRSLDGVGIGENVSPTLDGFSYEKWLESFIVQRYKENLEAINQKSVNRLNDAFQDKYMVNDAQSLVRGQENGGAGDFTNVAAGMSRFLADRAMQELNESFFMMMEKQLKKYSQLGYFFPATKDYLTHVKDQQRFINLDYIKNYFEKDIKQFPLNFYRFKDEFMDGKGKSKENSGSFYNAFKVDVNNTLTGRWISLGLDAMYNSAWGTSPMHLINNLVHSQKAENLNEMLHVERMLAKIIEGRRHSQLVNEGTQNEKLSELLIALHDFVDCRGVLKNGSITHSIKDSINSEQLNFIRKALIYNGKANEEYVKKLIQIKQKSSLESKEEKAVFDTFRETLEQFLRYKFNSFHILTTLAESGQSIDSLPERVKNINLDFKNQLNTKFSAITNIDTLIVEAYKMEKDFDQLRSELSRKVFQMDSTFKVIKKDSIEQRNKWMEGFKKDETKATFTVLDNAISFDYSLSKTAYHLYKSLHKDSFQVQSLAHKKMAIMDYYCNLIDYKAGNALRERIYNKVHTPENVARQFNFYNALKLIDLISTQLIDLKESNLWIEKGQFQKFLEDQTEFSSFVDALKTIDRNVKEYDIKFYKTNYETLSLNDLLDTERLNVTLAEKGVNKLELFRKFLVDVYQTYNGLNELAHKIKEKSSEGERLTHLNQIFSSLEELMEVTTEYFYYHSGREIKFDPGVIFNTIGPCINFAHNIRKKDYHLAIEDVLLILGNFTDKGLTNNNYNKFLTKMSTYGNVVAKVAVAENSDQVKAAIESSVLPVGSSRMKRYADFSITLNAYVGVFGGQAMYKERVDGIVVNRNLTTFGMTAPIGLGFNWGKIRLGDARTAFSLNAQIFDLGTLVNFYMKHGDEAMLPESTKIRFKDIIAPGFTAAWSLGNTPLSLIGGVQFIPNLNQMGILEGEQKFQSLAWRAQLGLAIDIPLYNIKVWNN